MKKRDKETREWLEKAAEDARSARILHERSTKVYPVICFHCQQAAEKVLKACLVSLSQSFDTLHSLHYLLELLTQHQDDFNKLSEEADILSPYAVVIRYPAPGRDKITGQDVVEAMEACHRVWDKAQNHIPHSLRIKWDEICDE